MLGLVFLFLAGLSLTVALGSSGDNDDQADNSETGGSGNDTLLGGLDRDDLYGGDGDDFLRACRV